MNKNVWHIFEKYKFCWNYLCTHLCSYLDEIENVHIDMPRHVFYTTCLYKTCVKGIICIECVHLRILYIISYPSHLLRFPSFIFILFFMSAHICERVAFPSKSNQFLMSHIVCAMQLYMLSLSQNVISSKHWVRLTHIHTYSLKIVLQTFIW